MARLYEPLEGSRGSCHLEGKTPGVVRHFNVLTVNTAAVEWVTGS